MTVTEPTTRGDAVLDNAAWASLTGAHAPFAVGAGRARRYRSEISPLLAVDDPDDDAAWADLAALVAPGEVVALAGVRRAAPAGWVEQARFGGVQLVATDALESRPDPQAVVLGVDDVPEMLDLVARTEPGPFAVETYRLGTYLGVRVDGRLVAMAGERLHPPGHTEISAVCTDPAFRGQGLAARLVRAVAAGIRERGETPFLHASATNTGAIRLYERLGFALRTRTEFVVVRRA